MTARKFRVMSPLATGVGSHLRFRGRWLVEAGFRPGERFTLTCPEPGKLVLQIDGPTDADKDFQAVFNRLDRAVKAAGGVQ